MLSMLLASVGFCTLKSALQPVQQSLSEDQQHQQTPGSPPVGAAGAAQAEALAQAAAAAEAEAAAAAAAARARGGIVPEYVTQLQEMIVDLQRILAARPAVATSTSGGAPVDPKSFTKKLEALEDNLRRKMADYQTGEDVEIIEMALRDQIKKVSDKFTKEELRKVLDLEADLQKLSAREEKKSPLVKPAVKKLFDSLGANANNWANEDVKKNYQRLIGILGQESADKLIGSIIANRLLDEFEIANTQEMADARKAARGALLASLADAKNIFEIKDTDGNAVLEPNLKEVRDFITAFVNRKNEKFQYKTDFSASSLARLRIELADLNREKIAIEQRIKDDGDVKNELTEEKQEELRKDTIKRQEAQDFLNAHPLKTVPAATLSEPNKAKEFTANTGDKGNKTYANAAEANAAFALADKAYRQEQRVIEQVQEENTVILAERKPYQEIIDAPEVALPDNHLWEAAQARLAANRALLDEKKRAIQDKEQEIKAEETANDTLIRRKEALDAEKARLLKVQF